MLNLQEPVLNLAVSGVDWLRETHDNEGQDLLALAFDLPDRDLRNEHGEFLPSRVFEAHYQKNHELIQRVVGHLQSLGVPPVYDALAAVCIVGWVVCAENQVLAAASLKSTYHYLAESDPELSSAVVSYFDKREPVLRQGRDRISRSIALARSGDALSGEVNALAFADAYKRLVEGPVRQYGWLHHCLRKGLPWSEVPMVRQIHEALLSHDSWVASVAAVGILPEFRNAEAHESLTWDGTRHEYVIDDDAIPVARVVLAAAWADSFARGCDAGVVCFKAASLELKLSLPSPDERGRMPAWRRAEALFGTNGLHVTSLDLNARVATVSLHEFFMENINPCFQALVNVNALLPSIEQFKVTVAGDPDFGFTVAAVALRATHEVWSYAVNTFSAMPFSTFLPANLDARGRVEKPLAAARSIAWIAIDDVLDALEASPIRWSSRDRKLYVDRLTLSRKAVAICLELVEVEHRFRLKLVQGLWEEILLLLADGSIGNGYDEISRLVPIAKARQYWETWGPVDRLPGVEPGPQERFRDVLIGHRQRPSDLRWRTI
ncbi:hypothetical protein [Kineosporia mesophila]|uniref:hypothetical protein n=1 Tax=Kineosporia mesophila TaxID=566012 RepID=UPI001E5239F9|nr:hypothetical protein [Kineosporia mesophila]MCD5349883.1 hypothetical protein [Kineosporia mesophila]